MRPHVGSWLVMALVAGSAFAVPPKAKTEATSAPKRPAEGLGKATPAYLNELARSLLRKRMQRHGHDMTMLVQAVILLQREVVVDLATSLVNEPRLTRPMPGESDALNSALPERFFVLQDELRERARALAETAATPDAQALATRLSEVTRTCVACHSAFLEPDEKERKNDEQSRP